MKILKSGVEMTPEELRASKAGKTCACACQFGFDTEDMWIMGADEELCACGCSYNPYSGSAESAQKYPY